MYNNILPLLPYKLLIIKINDDVTFTFNNKFLLQVSDYYIRKP